MFERGSRRPPGRTKTTTPTADGRCRINDLTALSDLKPVRPQLLLPPYKDTPTPTGYFPGSRGRRSAVRHRIVCKMATVRYHLDPWRTKAFTYCGGICLGSELEDGDNGAERDCPKCHEAILFFSFGSVDELAGQPEALSPGEREDFAARSDFVARWNAGLLKSPEELPDLSGTRITLIWDPDQDTQDGMYQRLRRADSQRC